MRPITLLCLALLILAGCERPADEPVREPPLEEAYPDAPPPPEPVPFDTLAVVEEARELERATEAEADAFTHRERIVDPAAPGEDPRRIVLWERDGLPVRLEVDEPDDAGEMTATSIYYFDEDTRLRYVRHPYARYVLDPEGRLLAWMDEHENVLHDIPEEDRRERAAALEMEARQYLEEFLVGPQ